VRLAPVDLTAVVGWVLLTGGLVTLFGVAAAELRPTQADRAVLEATRRGHPAARLGRYRVAEFLVGSTAVALLVGITLVASQHSQHLVFLVSWYVSSAVTGASLVAHICGRRFLHLPVASGKVLAVVPAFNEPPAALYACVESLLNQTVPVDIVVIDDGSVRPVPPRWRNRVRWVYQPNFGKSGAQCAVLRMFRRDEYDFVLTVDSDSVAFCDALEHLLRAMSNPRVWAATGWMYVGNYDTNLVTAAADIDIGVSCVMGRASRSMLGVLETTSGALALYRSQLIYDHLEEYASSPRSIDDDRWLATRALRRGQVVAVREAVVVTAMPESLGDTRRQRTRWARSWFSVLPYMIRRLRGTALISPAVELLDILMLPLVVGYGAYRLLETLVWGYLDEALVVEVAGYLAATATMRLCQSALYLLDRPGMSTAGRWYAWFFGTFAALGLGFVIITPARYWALLRVRDKSWGTRGTRRSPVRTRVRASAIVALHRYRSDATPAGRAPHRAGHSRGRHAACNEVTQLLPTTRQR
jgi:hyaluronan synthase